MAIQTYVAFTDRMIHRYEGGYCWDAKDPGGPTKYGITCFDLAAHLGRKMNSMSEWAPIVKAMDISIAILIYKKKYAAAVRYDDLPAGIDVVMYDYGVNSGIGRPIRVARAILKVPGGASMDAALLTALQKTDPKKFIANMCAERLNFMHAIRGGSAWQQFGKGWGARVADLKAYATHLVDAPGTSVAPTAPDLSNVPTPKAQHGDPETAKNVIKGTVGTALPTGAGTGYAGVPISLIAVSVGFVVVAGVGYYFYRKQADKRANEKVVLPPEVEVTPAALAA